MLSPFSRSALLLGEEAINTLTQTKILLFGVGGVGSYVAEALCRSGIGAITLVDSDTIALTNLNRQLCALHSTLGQPKVEVVKARLLDINPDCQVTAVPKFVTKETVQDFSLSRYDYIVDAIDTVSAKIALAVEADRLQVPLISCMGAGNKLNPMAFVVTDLYKTSVCPLARVMRQELKKRGLKKLKVVYSTEPAQKPKSIKDAEEPAASRRQTPGSLPFVPAAAGLLAASAVVYDLLNISL